MSKRILHVVTNVAHYADPAHPTGLWLLELTHAWEIFAAKGRLAPISLSIMTFQILQGRLLPADTRSSGLPR